MEELGRPVCAVAEVCLMVRRRGLDYSLCRGRSGEVDRVLGRVEDCGLGGGRRGGRVVAGSESVRGLSLVSWEHLL